MTADRLTQEEQMEARRKAQNIQKTINMAAVADLSDASHR